ncbi:hypothetical protein [Herbaspirillum rhizosphaerae]|uniref:hypothetical protein n=1 Tax=Herbaspirillum rhizosphaerae TaxID=346179 RepID=UPI00067C399E|nr:hypothetical protein [Herbaspirillum rhizosphaerae]
MSSFLWVFAVFCSVVYLFNLNKFASSCAAWQTPEQRQRQFIVDVCDGNRRQADRLINEKAQSHPDLGVSQVLQLVYHDMLDLTAEERAAAQISLPGYAVNIAVKGRPA